MAKINLGSMFSIANGRDAVSGESYQYLRSAHSSGGNKAFRRCVAEKLRGQGGSPIAVRERMASAAKSCQGVGDRGRR
jgi:hypothetical protein